MNFLESFIGYLLSSGIKAASTKQNLYNHLLPILHSIKENEQDILGTAGEVRTNFLRETSVLVKQQNLTFISFVRTFSAIYRT